MSIETTPRQRLDIKAVAPAAYKSLIALDSRSATGPLPGTLLDLIRLRVSQINGCAYCVDAHSLDAVSGGEPQVRVNAVAVWEEGPFFDARERAAFGLAESMTRLSEGGHRVGDDVWSEAAEQFTKDELGQLIMVITTINAWNRLGVGLRMVPDSFVAEEAAS